MHLYMVKINEDEYNNTGVFASKFMLTQPSVML